MAGKRLMNLFQLKRNSMANRLDLLMNSSAALVLVIFLLLAGPLEAWQEATALAMIGLAATRPVVALLRHYATWPRPAHVRSTIPPLLVIFVLLGVLLLMPLALVAGPWHATAFGIGLLCGFLLDRADIQRADP
jgi:hypothetical protein